MRAEGFSCSLDFLYAIFDPKNITKNISAVFFCSIFGHQNPRSGLDPDPGSLEMPDPYPNSMNPDPQLWFFGILTLFDPGRTGAETRVWSSEKANRTRQRPT